MSKLLTLVGFFLLLVFQSMSGLAQQLRMDGDPPPKEVCVDSTQPNTRTSDSFEEECIQELYVDILSEKLNMAVLQRDDQRIQQTLHELEEYNDQQSDRIINGVGNGVLLPAAVKVFTGAISTLWSNPNNWSPPGLPGVNDDVSFNALSTKSVVMDISPKIRSLTRNSNYINNFSALAGQSLVISRDLVLSAGGVSGVWNFDGATVTILRNLTVSDEVGKTMFTGSTINFSSNNTHVITGLNVALELDNVNVQSGDVVFGSLFNDKVSINNLTLASPIDINGNTLKIGYDIARSGSISGNGWIYSSFGGFVEKFIPTGVISVAVPIGTQDFATPITVDGSIVQSGFLRYDLLNASNPGLDYPAGTIYYDNDGRPILGRHSAFVSLINVGTDIQGTVSIQYSRPIDDFTAQGITVDQIRGLVIDASVSFIGNPLLTSQNGSIITTTRSGLNIGGSASIVGLSWGVMDDVTPFPVESITLSIKDNLLCWTILGRIEVAENVVYSIVYDKDAQFDQGLTLSTVIHEQNRLVYTTPWNKPGYYRITATDINGSIVNSNPVYIQSSEMIASLLGNELQVYSSARVELVNMVGIVAWTIDSSENQSLYLDQIPISKGLYGLRVYSKDRGNFIKMVLIY